MTEDAHEVVAVEWVPVCATCGKPVHTDDADRWAHTRVIPPEGSHDA